MDPEMINAIRRLWFRVRLLSWRRSRREVARMLSHPDNLIFRDGEMRISFLTGWDLTRSKYVVWRWRPCIRRARVYGEGLTFGEAGEIVRRQLDSQLDFGGVSKSLEKSIPGGPT